LQHAALVASVELEQHDPNAGSVGRAGGQSRGVADRARRTGGTEPGCRRPRPSYWWDQNQGAADRAGRVSDGVAGTDYSSAVGIFDRFKRRPEADRQAGARPAYESQADELAADELQADADAPSTAEPLVADAQSASGALDGGAQSGRGSAAGGAQQVADLREQVELWVRPGFLARADVLEYARDFRDDDEMPVDDEELAQLVDEVWRARVAEQQAWPAYTDADRVAAAFADLDANGVVARMNFTCCQNCGVAEIDDERPADRPSTGYVFFHQQDAERLADEPAQLYLAYGTLDPEQGRVAEQDQAVGEQIRAALLAQDLPVEWDGSSAQRISVGPLTWRRRLR
jgi:hypothetical protein